jgi:hypothetical protein
VTLVINYCLSVSYKVAVGRCEFSVSCQCVLSRLLQLWHVVQHQTMLVCTEHVQLYLSAASLLFEQLRSTLLRKLDGTGPDVCIKYPCCLQAPAL